MIEVFTLGAALTTLLVSVISMVLLKRSLPEFSCQHAWCWRRVVSVQEKYVPAEMVPDGSSDVTMNIPLCRKHEALVDESVIAQDFKDRFGD